jgi:hypothetical protein
MARPQLRRVVAAEHAAERKREPVRFAPMILRRGQLKRDNRRKRPNPRGDAPATAVRADAVRESKRHATGR